MSQRSPDPTQDGVGKYVTLLLLVAVKHGHTHVRIKPSGTTAIVQFWDDIGWTDRDDVIDRDLPLHMPVMRKLAEMLAEVVPTPGKQAHGAFMLQRSGIATLYVHGRIENDFEVIAELELVDEATFGTRPYRRPRASA